MWTVWRIRQNWANLTSLYFFTSLHSLPGRQATTDQEWRQKLWIWPLRFTYSLQVLSSPIHFIYSLYFTYCPDNWQQLTKNGGRSFEYDQLASIKLQTNVFTSLHLLTSFHIFTSIDLLSSLFLLHLFIYWLIHFTSLINLLTYSLHFTYPLH